MSGRGFDYVRAADSADAVVLGAQPGAAFLAGGTDLMQLSKAHVQAPGLMVDISRLPLSMIVAVDSELHLGALARLSDVAAHPDVARHAPLIVAAVASSASGQIRNMATLGGNLLQRTRCVYFRSDDFPCNKRLPGSGCGALDGENRQSALFGASAACVATHPSDLAVALVTLDADVDILGTAGARRVRLADVYRLPGDTPQFDTTLAPDDLVTGVRIGDAARFAPRSTYLKVRDRAAFEFAVVSVAAALRLENGVIVEARLVAGGVAPLPWRLTHSETALIGRRPGASAFAAAGGLAVTDARPLVQNGFKVDLLRRAVIRALETVGGEA